jgi:glycine hydroxymethyltransferase
MHTVAAKAVALREAGRPEFREYARQVVGNAQALTTALEAEGMRPVAGGTDTHLALLDVRPLGVTGAQAEQRCDAARITLNKNAIPYDPQRPTTASGIRVGTPAVTTQGMGTPQMRQIATLIGRAVRAEAPPAELADEVGQLVERFPVYPRTGGPRPGSTARAAAARSGALPA